MTFYFACHFLNYEVAFLKLVIKYQRIDDTAIWKRQGLPNSSPSLLALGKRDKNT